MLSPPNKAEGIIPAAGVNASDRTIALFFAYGQPLRPTVFAEHLSPAISGARTFSQVNQLSAAIWKAHGAGLLSDADAQSAAEALQAQKALIGVSGRPPAHGASHGLRKPVRSRSPDRQASLARRRTVALSGAVPSKLAAGFTMSELAVLSVVAGEVKRHGSCQLPIDALAALAGCSRTTAQNAFRQAVRLGLIHVRERRRPGQKNLTNVVTVISPAWKAWLRLGTDRVQNSEHHVKHYKTMSERHGSPLANPMRLPQTSIGTQPNRAASNGLERRRT